MTISEALPRDPRPPRHLGDVLSGLATIDGIGPRLRRDLISAIYSFARISRASPEDLAATCPALRARIRSTNPALAGVTKRTWCNVRSLLGKAMALTGCPIECQRRSDPIDTGWSQLLATVEARYRRIPFLRFARWCTRHGIVPMAVDDAVVKAFLEHLVERTLVPVPGNVVRNLVKIWNESRQAVPLWPDLPLTPFRNRQPYVLPVSAFPPSFRAEYEAFEARLARRDLFAKDGPSKPLRPATVKARLFSLRQAASALVIAGRPVESVTGLGVLVQPPAAKTILEFFWRRAGNRATSQTTAVGEVLVMIAKHFAKVPPDTLSEIKRCAAMVAHRQKGLVAKNAERLRHFDEQGMVARFLALPEQLMGEARRTLAVDSQKARLFAATAMALKLLQFAPIRAGNLCALHQDRHLRYAQGRRSHIPELLVIPGAEVKNRRDIELPLPPEVGPIFRSYMQDFRSIGIDEPGGWLFPTTKGTPITVVTAFRMMTAATERELGFPINTHLMRHIAAKLYLDRHPGDYETVRILLGHATVETAKIYYAGLETRAAIERFHDVVLRPDDAHRRAFKNPIDAGWGAHR